jgi:predicted protein tyrosine phosphatase
MLEGKRAEQEVSNNLLATKIAPAYEKTSDGLEKKFAGLKKKQDAAIKREQADADKIIQMEQERSKGVQGRSGTTIRVWVEQTCPRTSGTGG